MPGVFCFEFLQMIVIIVPDPSVSSSEISAKRFLTYRAFFHRHNFLWLKAPFWLLDFSSWLLAIAFMSGAEYNSRVILRPHYSLRIEADIKRLLVSKN